MSRRLVRSGLGPVFTPRTKDQTTGPVPEKSGLQTGPTADWTTETLDHAQAHLVEGPARLERQNTIPVLRLHREVRRASSAVSWK
jgi:hypothetical protein